MKPYLARTLPLIGILAVCFPAYAQDADSDFLSDSEELVVGSDPYDTDTDGDGILDRNELYPFQIVAGTFTYEAALADAASKGGRVVVIDSLDKLYQVKRGLLTTALPNPLPNNYDPTVTLANPLWIGAEDVRSDGRYQWADFGSTLAIPINLSELGSAVFGDLTPGSSTVSNVVNVGALTVGRPFVASGVPSGTTITAIDSAARTLTLSNPVASILSQRISRVVVSNAGYGFTSPPVVSFSGASGVSSVTVTAGGSLYVNPPTVSFTGGTGSGATAIATVSGGVVTGVTITSRGSYTVAPTGVSFTPVGGGSGAAATVSLGTGPTTAVTLSAGRIQSITVTGDGGTFYTAAPTVTISGGNGGGALATAVLTLAANGNVSAAAVTAPGTGYTNTTTVTIAGGGGTGATAVATVVAGQVTGIAILNPGSDYTSAPVVTITGAGTGATATASIRQFSGRVSSPVPGAYVNWASDLLPGNRVNSQEGVFLSAGSTFTWETAQIATLRGYLLERPPTQPANADTDGDGLSDGVETNTGTFASASNTGTNPLDEDTDNDGLSDSDEVALGTNPLLVDSDNDGRPDGAEVDAGTDPLVADKKDTDGDGVNDADELNLTQTDPNTPSFGPGTETETIPFSNSLVSGDYAGLMFDPRSGQTFKQNLRLSTKGSFSSSLLGLVADSSFKGTFSATGAFTGVPNPTSGLISVQMNLVKQGVNKYYIEGNFKTRTGGTLYFQLRHTLYSKSYAYSSAGKVTFEAALLTSASGPSGSAVATGSISTSGQVAFKIYLPDGSSSSYSAPIVDGDLIPLFSRSSSKARTVLLGTLKLQDLSGQSDFAGSVRLFSAVGATGSLFPSGFDQLRELTGSRYYPPITGVLPLASFSPSANNSVFSWVGGNFDGVQKVGTWATNGQMTIPATQNDRSKATFTSSSGLLTLSYTRTDATRSLLNAPSKGYAVVVQKSKTFKGYYTSGLSAGDFVVDPNTSGINPEITSVSPLNKSISAAATSYSVTVGTAGAWAVVIPSSVNWITATVSSAAGETGPSATTLGNGNGTVVISVTLNVTNARREAEITIAGIKHTIKQEFR
jgi:hypothetical protein